MEEKIISGRDMERSREKRFQEMIVSTMADSLALCTKGDVRQEILDISRDIALKFDIFPASIAALYKKSVEGDGLGFTVPAFNIRTLTYDLARAIFRGAKKLNAGAFIFEIARREIQYTEQRPKEYAAQILLAAIREGYKGPIFIQGDHFQVNTNAF